MTWQESTDWDTAMEGHLTTAPDFSQQPTKIPFAALPQMPLLGSDPPSLWPHHDKEKKDKN